jgi:NitT/TauT family transport system substrate-binding protein
LPLLLASLLLLAACSSGGSAPGTGAEAVRLQLNWFPEPEFGGMYAARERGIFEKHGVAIELLEGGADVPAAQLVASGRVELAVVAADQLLTLRAAGGPARAIFACFQKAPRVVIVKNEAGWDRLSQLWRSNATIMAAEGLAFVQYLNAKHGGEDLTFVPYSGSTTPFVLGAVTAVQGFATAEPIQLKLDGVPVKTFLVADEGFDPYDVVVVANEGWLSREPETAAAVVRALREGWRSYLDDPGPINELMASLNKDLSKTVMDASAELLPDFVESRDTKDRALGWMTGERWGRLNRQLTELGLLERPLETAAVFTNPVE